MKIREFFNTYPDEQSCKEAFLNFRLKMGVICKKCGSHEHYWYKNKGQFECKRCKFRTTLRSGTVLQSSKLPYSYWIIAMYLMTNGSKTISARQLQSELSHKRYEPIWAIMHKIRRVMGMKQNEKLMEGFQEMDDAFFVIKTPKSKQIGSGRGSSRTAPVLVMAETGPINANTSKAKHSSFKRVKMVVMPDLTSESIEKVTAQSISKNSVIYTDGYSAFRRLYPNWVHSSVRIEPQIADKVLPWVHTCISNAKRLILGIFHCVSDGYLQNYLDEYTYKTNLRYQRSNLFNLLIYTCVTVQLF